MKETPLLISIKNSVFSLSSLIAFAKRKLTDPYQMNEIIGQVKSVRQGYLKIFPSSLIVKDMDGRKHLIKASSKSLKGIREGDSVEVKTKNGKAQFIIKLSRRIIIHK